jgi:hypothetical protein
MKGPCPELEPLLSPFLDGELGEADTRRVEEHLATCAACRALVDEWRAAESALARSGPVRSDVEWERLARRVDAAIDEAEGAALGKVAATRAASPAPSRANRSWMWGGSGALVAAALILLCWPWIVGQPGEPPARLSEPSRPSTLPAAPAETKEAAPPAPERGLTDRAGPSPVVRAPVPEVPREKDEALPAAPAAEPDAGFDVRRVAKRTEIGAGLDLGNTSAEERAAPAADTLPEEAPREALSVQAAPRTAPEAAYGQGSMTKSLPRDFAMPEVRSLAPAFDELQRSTADALASGELERLRSAAAGWDAWLVTAPDGPPRALALGQCVRLAARLVDLDPSRECEPARAALARWRAGNSPDASALGPDLVHIERACTP